MRGYNIESGLNNTFNKLDNSVNQVASKMGDGMGLGKQINERPWLMVGAALALGYVVGTFVGGNDDDEYEDNRSSRRQYARTNQYASRYNDIGEHASGRSSTNYTSPTSVGDKQSAPASGTYSGQGTAQTSHTGTHSGHASTYSYEGSSYNPEHSAPKASSMPSAPNTTSTPNNFAKGQQSGQQSGVQSAISSLLGDQLDTATATATSAVRSFLRDTIRDAVPSMRDQVDALDRRDGRVPPSTSSTSTPRASSIGGTSSTPRDVDTTF